jgi:hypothetical protein
MTIDRQLTKDAEISMSCGSITAHFIPDIQVDINASALFGRIKSDFEIDTIVNKMSVRGSINGGRPELTLISSGGSVNIIEI